MTKEEYFWFFKHPQNVRNAYASVAACGGRHAQQARQFLENLKAARSPTEEEVEHGDCGTYFWQSEISNYYWDDMIGRNPAPPMSYCGFGCSGMRKGKIHGRNYDYYYDKTPEILLKVPENESHYASMSIVQFPSIQDSDLCSVSQTLRNQICRIPFVVIDGINQHGLVAQQNMLPVGDNPDYNMEFNRVVNGEIEYHEHWNRTYHTNPGKPRRCLSLFIRTVLDRCRSVREAVDLLKDEYDWFGYFDLMGGEFKTSGLELHFMMSDISSSAIVEFINTEYSLSGYSGNSDIYVTWFDDTHEISATRITKGVEVVVGGETQKKPIMGNFYVSKWNGDCSGFSSVPVSNDTLTRYSIGLERYSAMRENYETIEGYQDMLSAMKDVEYDRAYADSGKHHSYPYSKYWNTEFCDPLNTDISDDFGNFNGLHIGMTTDNFKTQAKKLCDKYHECWNEKTRLSSVDPECPWITVNRSVYDIENKKLYVVVQQDGVAREFQL